MCQQKSGKISKKIFLTLLRGQDYPAGHVGFNHDNSARAGRESGKPNIGPRRIPEPQALAWGFLLRIPKDIRLRPHGRGVPMRWTSLPIRPGRELEGNRLMGGSRVATYHEPARPRTPCRAGVNRDRIHAVRPCGLLTTSSALGLLCAHAQGVGDSLWI